MSSQPRRVLLVNHTGAMSGAEHSLRLLASALAERCAVVVALPPGPAYDALAEAGIRCLPLASPARDDTGVAAKAAGWGATLRSLSRVVDAFEPSLLHANSLRAGFLCALLPIRAPLVVHVRDTVFTPLVRRVVLPVVRRRAAAAITVSRHTERALLRVQPMPTHVLYNPIGERFRPPSAEERRAARERVGVAPEHVLAVHVAQLVDWKQQDLSIQALAECHAGGSGHLRLALIGDTVDTDPATAATTHAYRESLHGLVARLGLEGSVGFAGAVADVLPWLWAADIAVLPSTDEPFGRAAAESMAAGVATIATDVGGPREFIHDGRSGLLRSPESAAAWAGAIRSLIDDPALRATIAAAGERAARRFTAEAHLESVLGVYGAVDR